MTHSDPDEKGTTTSVTPEEKALITAYRTDPEKREYILKYLDTAEDESSDEK